VADHVPRVVLDTNVLISALLGHQKNPPSPPVSSLQLALDGFVQLVTSPAMVAELVHALSYPKLRVTIEAAHEFAAIVTATAGPKGLVQTTGSLNILSRDPADNIVLETALRGGANYVVTGNIADFAELGEEGGTIAFEGIRIISPREFVASKF